LNVFPRRERRDGAEQCGQNDQQHGDAVDAHLITRTDKRDPLVIFEELHAADAAVVLQQPEREDEIEHEPAGGKFFDQARLIFLHDRQNENGADRRQPGDERKNVIVHINSAGTSTNRRS
jgi:hypothetical protein